jgi:FkbM family methyltransferase
VGDCEPRVLAVVFAESASNDTLTALSLASVRGFAPACACVASDATEKRVRGVVQRASPSLGDVSVLRVADAGDSAYRDACLRSCLSMLPPACSAHSYALSLEAGQALELTPGAALHDATHAGVPEPARAGVAAGLAAALARRNEGYLLWAATDYVQQAALPLLLRADAPWTYDAQQRAWRGGVAADALHSGAFALRIDSAARLLENHARFVANAELFAQREAADSSDGESLYFLAHSLKDAGAFTRALPLFERRIAMGVASNGAQRDHVFLSHMLSGRIHAVHGSVDAAVECYLSAVDAHPLRRTEALTELATMLRLAGQLPRALLFAKAASQAALADAPPPEGALYVNDAPYDFMADLEYSLAAYSAPSTEVLVDGAQALARLLSKPHIGRRYWLASFDNAAAFAAKIEPASEDAARQALAALRAAMSPTPHVCSHERVLLNDAAVVAAGDTSCGPGSVLGRLFSDVAVIEMPSRERRVARFMASMGCSRYLRFSAVTRLTPAELSRNHNPRLRNGEIRLVQAHACVLQYAAALPADARPLAIFEDDVEPVPPAALPAVQHVTARLVSAFDSAGADMVLLGRCPCSPVDDTLPADALLQPVKHAFAPVCAHAYAVTPAAAARLHAALLASAASLPAELDMLYLRMQERRELRVFTNAGASVYSQTQLAGALSNSKLKGPQCAAVEMPPAVDKPPLKLTSFGHWVSSAVTLDEMWLLSLVLQNVTGRDVLRLDPARIAEADIILVGVFAADRALVEAMVAERSAKAVIIFVVGENTLADTHVHGSAYRDQLVPLADVSLGHRRDVDAPTYLHFPWWIPSSLARRSAASSLDAVGFHPALLQRVNASAWAARPGFALFVNGHEAHPRRELFALASSVGRVDAPGRALNTMPWPRNFGNDFAGKSALLARYRITLCPESSASPDGGYVTEKLPQAHLEGAVPLYWGDAAAADGEVWNLRRVLVYDNSSSNAELLATMRRLEHEPAFRDAWFAEPVLAPGAEAWLRAFLARLAGHFSRALAAKGHTVVAARPRAFTYPYAAESGLLGRDFFETGVERQIQELVRQSVGGSALFVDVGANTGFFSLLAASYGSSVLSFEPQPHCADLMRATLASSNAHLAGLIDFRTAALGDPADGSISVPVDTCWGGFNGGAMEHAAAQHAAVPLVSLTASVAPTPAQRSLVFKIDTEGAEVGVLKGVLELRERHPERAVRVIVELIPRLWPARGSSTDEGVAVLRRLQRWFAVTLLHDDTAFGFPRREVQLPGGIGGAAYDSFDVEALMQDRLRADAGCNLLLDYAPPPLQAPVSLSAAAGSASAAQPVEPPRVHLVSLCSCAFELRRLAFAAEARGSGLFDSVQVAALDDVDATFREQHAAILARERGCGYWIWKAKATLAAVAFPHVRPGDVLAYVDCGCTFNAHARPVFEAWVAGTLAAPSGLLGLQMNHLERDWTKADLLHHLGAENDAAVTHTGQLLGGIWLLRVQPSTVALLHRWLEVKTAEAYRFLDDTPSRLPNAPTFQEHRHDQSVWSVLRKQVGAVMVPDITYRNASAPIRAARCMWAEGCDPPSRPPAFKFAPATSAGLLSGKLHGGLGNQLFVAARVQSLAAHTGRTPVVYTADAGTSVHTPAGVYVDTVFSRYVRTDTAPDLVVGESAEFVAAPPPSVPSSARHAHLDGYWQHESNIRPDFVATLALPSVPPRPHTAFVHVRRGDYVGHRVHDVGLLADGYYAAAMALLRAKAADPLLRFLVFSDDVAWCRQSPLFAGADDVDFFDDGDDAVLSLMTMAACELGGVAANSSFSWWAAFLSSSPLRVLVFPLRWLNGFSGPIDVWLNNSYVVRPDGQAQLVRRPPPPAAFDLILYINLDSRVDKRAEIEAELAKVGWSGRRLPAVHRVPGELGCALSHAAAMQLLLDHPSARHALILEDDFGFVRDPSADVARFLSRFDADGWDVLMLASNTRKEQPHGDADYVTRILEAQTTSGYAVTRAFAPTLLRSFNESAALLADERNRHYDGAVRTEHCIDQHWKRLQPDARWFCLAPRAGVQRPGLSDITGLVVDHGGV